MKFAKLPVEIEATQWFKNGDHPMDYSRTHDGLENGEMRQFTPEERKANGWEGDIVRYFRRPDIAGTEVCKHCDKTMHIHGWIDTLEGGHIVCPGDWVITGIKGERYPCKPDIFAGSYRPVSDAPQSITIHPSGEISGLPPGNWAITNLAAKAMTEMEQRITVEVAHLEAANAEIERLNIELERTTRRQQGVLMGKDG